MKLVSAAIRRIRPDVRISAAVFRDYARDSVGVAQDWVTWAKQGYVDFLCPMDYAESDLEFIRLVTNQVKLVDRRIPIYPGIGATASNARLTPDRVIGQIHHARSLGADGFTIFNLHSGTIADVVPAVGLGAGSTDAVPPHSSGATGGLPISAGR